MLDKMKQLYDLQKKAKAVQKELKETEIEGKSSDGSVTVIFNGEMHIVSLKLSEEAMQKERRELEQAITKTIAETISRAQAYAAEKSKALLGNLNIPGMS